ncbi:site-specific integrase [Pseudomonas luteola]|uniref:tyrosine-type recombinase/integrase n=1 Tax=Pseudomonas luteola TaxID=47886 RepID=UPI000F7B96AC|nr:site-specific integrase [Pseudomonas luteola]RRW40375.1 site-specific integrase [Pseudomonas luteola]
MSKLTPKLVKALSEPGSYQDGRGLQLRISAQLRKSWIYRYMINGRRHDLSVGSYPAVSLRDARLAADKYRLEISRGINPVLERRKEREGRSSQKLEAKTFQTEAARYIRTHSPSWSTKHSQQWQNSLAKHVFPIIGSMPLAQIDTDDVLEVLEPIWSVIPVTASRLRNRIELVLDAAKARKLREGENPARWRGHLDKLLPRQGSRVKPFASLSAEDTARLMHRLDSLEGAAARATELMILTATRNSETCGARWSELDLEQKLWTIPGERMKTGKTHRIPLTEAMIEVISQQKGQHPEWVFPNSRRTGCIPGNAIGRVLDTLKVHMAVPHGFRATFRTWAAETTSYPREVCEMALAHTLGSKVEAAYNRGDLLEKRRGLMQEWSGFLCKGHSTSLLLTLT